MLSPLDHSPPCVGPAGASDVVVIGYGSLMSGLGLSPFRRLRVGGAFRVALSNARRGFAKLSRYGNRLAMVLEPIHPERPITARTAAAGAPPSDGPEGIALLVGPNDLARLCEREGYSRSAMQHVRQAAAARGQEVAAFLWSLLDAAGFAIPVFRQRLCALAGSTSPHYIPHPVALDGTRYGITFLAPGREGSGAPAVVPVRVRTGHLELLNAAQAWANKPNDTQLAYFAACLLGGVHGICLHDLLQPLVAGTPVCERIRETIAAELPREVGRLRQMTGLDQTAYQRWFGHPAQSGLRSGLTQFLRQGDIAIGADRPARRRDDRERRAPSGG